MEAGAGIEPAHAGFAVPSITTLLPGPAVAPTDAGAEI